MEVFAVPYGPQHIIYAPLKQLAFVGNAATVNLINGVMAGQPAPTAASAQQAMAFLNDLGFFGPEPEPPHALDNPDDFRPTVAVLFLTTACNFRCVYCYADGGAAAPAFLSPEVGERAIDHACRNAQTAGLDSFSVAFHGGGEPTLAWETLQRLVEHARSRELPSRITLTSNGYWTTEQCDWLVDRVDEISLSFDGLAEVQNRQRPLQSGKGAYDRVMAAITALDRSSMPYGLRLTVTDRSASRLAESIELLCDQTTCRVFQAEPAFAHGRARRDGEALTRHDLFVNGFMEAYDAATVRDRHLYYSGARPWLTTNRFCAAVDNALIATPGGKLSACYEVYGMQHPRAEEFFFGAIDENGGLQVDHARRRRLLNKIAARRSQCADCFCCWHCAGDCPAKTFGDGPEDHLTFGPRCEVNRRITQELLIRWIAAGGGVWRGQTGRADPAPEGFDRAAGATLPTADA